MCSGIVLYAFFCGFKCECVSRTTASGFPIFLDDKLSSAVMTTVTLQQDSVMSGAD
jgi:hypothetical protein